jgi:predicted small metal-binding protein
VGWFKTEAGKPSRSGAPRPAGSSASLGTTRQIFGGTRDAIFGTLPHQGLILLPESTRRRRDVAKDDTSKSGQEFIIPNPSINPETHAVNPSAPTIGTEGWGLATDERRALSGTEPEAAQPGQVKHDPGTNQTDLSRRTSSTGTSVNVAHDRTFRCADVGNADCRWETSGATDEEIIEQARDHAQTVHGWNDWTEALRDRVRDAIRDRSAA